MFRRLRLVPVLAMLLLTASVPVTTACATTTGDGKGCCRVCRTGKPCGDSCIARDKNCTKSGGCACSGMVWQGDIFGVEVAG